MKRLIFLIIFLFLVLIKSDAQDFWEHVITPDSIGIEDIAVDSAGIIYIACHEYWVGKGGVYRSEDNGATWQQFRNGLAHPYILALNVDDQDNLFIGGTGVIYKSTDHADTWDTVLTANFENVIVIRCGYDSIVLVGGGDATGIFRSGDHGTTWQMVLSLDPIGYNEWITDICFGPNGTIYACSSTIYAGIGKIYQSADLGKTWQEFPPEEYYSCIGFDNEGRLIAGTYGAGIYRYDFADSTWEHILLGGTPNDILVVPDNKIFLSWSYGRVMQSDDDGNTYYSNSTGLSDFYDMRDFATDQVGRILVHGGYLYRSYDAIFTDIKTTKNDKLNYQNCYPNPLGAYTEFYFSPESKQTEGSDLSIYTSSGNLILKRKIHPGENFRWDAGHYSPGIYLARIISNESMTTIKLVHY
jgi:photosystem II stability/assembly factor-like uncharacterized protein